MMSSQAEEKSQEHLFFSLCLSQEALTLEEQLLEEKDAELRRVQKEVEALLQESKTHLQALDEEKERNRIQVMSSRVLSAAV